MPMCGTGVGVGVGSGSVKVWRPTMLGSTCKLWLRPESSFLTITGGKVETWLDQSGAGNDFTQANAALRPVYTASDPAFNGMGSATLTGTELLSRATFVWAACHVFYVSKYAEDPAVSWIEWAPLPWCASAADGDVFWADRTMYYGLASSARKSCGQPAAILTTKHKTESLSKAGGYSLTVGTEALYSTAVNTVGWPAGTVDIGARAVPVTGFHGKLSEVIACDTEQTGINLANIRAYLTAKYAL
jgi:hypothetical protein